MRATGRSRARPAAQAFGSILQSTLYPVLVITQHLQYGPAAANHANAQAFFLHAAPSLLNLSRCAPTLRSAHTRCAAQSLTAHRVRCAALWTTFSSRRMALQLASTRW